MDRKRFSNDSIVNFRYKDIFFESDQSPRVSGGCDVFGFE